MDPQKLPKTSKLYYKSKKCDIEKTLGGGWVPPPFGSPKVNYTGSPWQALFKSEHVSLDRGFLKFHIKSRNDWKALDCWLKESCIHAYD